MSTADFPSPAEADYDGGEQGLSPHEREMRAAHGCVPSPEAAVKRGSAGAPAPDHGPDPGSVVG